MSSNHKYDTGTQVVVTNIEGKTESNQSSPFKHIGSYAVILRHIVDQVPHRTWYRLKFIDSDLEDDFMETEIEAVNFSNKELATDYVID